MVDQPDERLALDAEMFGERALAQSFSQPANQP